MAQALGYLRVCSLGAPAGTLWLAANGIFRGLGDTATPLVTVIRGLEYGTARRGMCP